VADVDDRLVHGKVAHWDLSANPVLRVSEIDRQDDLLAVLRKDRPRLIDEALELVRFDNVHRRGAKIHALRDQHYVGDKARGEHSIDDPVAQGRGHHRERFLDLRATEHEDARPIRLLTQMAEGAVLALEQPAHR